MDSHGEECCRKLSMFSLYDISALPLTEEQKSLIDFMLRAKVDGKPRLLPRTFVWEMDSTQLNANYEQVVEHLSRVLDSGLVVVFKASTIKGVDPGVRLVVGTHMRRRSDSYSLGSTYPQMDWSKPTAD